MARTKTRSSAASTLLVALALAGACDEGQEIGTSSERGSGRAAPPPAAPVATSVAKDADNELVFKDDDFVESEHNRDPFRSYVSAFRSRGPEASGSDPQRPVIMPTTAVEEMRLIAVISGLTRPKAMLLDTLGVGYVVERGDYIGRAKVLQATGSVAMTLNWRVDRIRENEVVLTRQDPTDPTRPPLSRIISMRQGTAEQ